MKRSLRGIFVSATLSATVLLGMAAASVSAQAVPTTPDPALAAVFAGASLPQSPSSGLMPEPTYKCGLYCDTTSSSVTPTLSGSGADCTSAQSSLTSQIQNDATTECRADTGFGHCNLTIYNTTSCTLTATGTYEVDGYGTYSCRDSSCLQ
jgi:hypothetical protein